MASKVSPTTEPPRAISGLAATVSDFSEYADTCSAVDTSSHDAFRKSKAALGREADRVQHAVEAVDVLAHVVGERVEVRLVGDVELDDRCGLGQPPGDDLRDAHRAPERGEHHLGALLLRDARHVEGDRGVGEHAGDEQALAVQKSHVPVPLEGEARQ